MDKIVSQWVNHTFALCANGWGHDAAECFGSFDLSWFPRVGGGISRLRKGAQTWTPFLLHIEGRTAAQRGTG